MRPGYTAKRAGQARARLRRRKGMERIWAAIHGLVASMVPDLSGIEDLVRDLGQIDGEYDQ